MNQPNPATNRESSPDPRHQPPTWQVTAVFDPDGTGQDFAYTIGLAERTGAELHVWCRPTDGNDPGADWKFSVRDAGRLLNDFAYRMIEGNLAVGEPIELDFDNGETRAVFTPAAAVPAQDLEAYQAGPATPTITLRWELHRAPEGDLAPIDATKLDDVIALCDRLTATVPTPMAVPERWRPVPGPLTADAFALDAEFGPTTPLVRAFAASMASAVDEELSAACQNSIMTEPNGGPRVVLGQSLAAARPHGRSSHVQHALATASELVDTITGTPEAPTDVWREVVRTLGEGAEPGEDPRFDSALTDCLQHMVAATIVTAVLHDVTDTDSHLRGYGPWMWAIATPATPEGWEAPDPARTLVRSLLGNLDAEALAALAYGYDAAMNDEQTHYALTYLRGYPIVAAAGVGDPHQLLGNPAAFDELDEDDQWLVSEALSVLVSAAAHSDRLHPNVPAALAAAYGPVLGDLTVLTS